MTEIKSFKKYSWLITIIIAIIVFMSGLTVADLSFLPESLKPVIVAVIGMAGIIVKLIPENKRVGIAEVLAVLEEREADNNYIYIEDDRLREVVKNHIENNTVDKLISDENEG